MTATPFSTTRPELPHWEEPPADLAGAIYEVKRAIRARIEASGRTVDEVARDFLVSQGLLAE